MEAVREARLIPERYPEHDLFICDFGDAVLKDMWQHMEHPFYSLSKKPDTSERLYEHRGNTLHIIPSVKGLATIYDKDILIYCISKIMHARNNGEKTSKRVRLHINELLMFTNRGTSGREYASLIDAFVRLEGTRIRTNIKTNDIENNKGFGLIEATDLKRNKATGRLIDCEITLSDWVYNAIEAAEVLTLHRDYFRLRKPLERRVYEIARKHCGTQKEWKVGLEILHKKSGSKSSEERFRSMVRDLVKHDHLPDYHVTLSDSMVTFFNRGPLIEEPLEDLWDGVLSPEARAEAKNMLPGEDMDSIEREWRMRVAEMGMAPDDPDKRFMQFCHAWAKKNAKS